MYEEMRLEDAILTACHAHYGEQDLGGSPYILHPLRVMLGMHTDEERITAVLHDVVEDTDIELDTLRAEGCPAPILEALDALTHRRGEEYVEYIERVAACPLARRVKLKDLEDNMRPERLKTVGDRERARLAKYQRAWDRLHVQV